MSKIQIIPTNFCVALPNVLYTIEPEHLDLTNNASKPSTFQKDTRKLMYNALYVPKSPV